MGIRVPATVLLDVSPGHDKYYMATDRWTAHGSSGLCRAIGVPGARAFTCRVHELTGRPSGREVTAMRAIHDRLCHDPQHGYVEVARVYGLEGNGCGVPEITAANVRVLFAHLAEYARIRWNLTWARDMIDLALRSGDALALVTAEQALGSAKEAWLGFRAWPRRAVDAEGGELPYEGCDLSFGWGPILPDLLLEKRKQQSMDAIAA